MKTKEVYKQRLDTELELAKKNLKDFEDRVKSKVSEADVVYEKEVDKLKKRVSEMNTKLNELNEAKDDAWEHLMDSFEKAGNYIGSSSKKITTNMKN